jgi:glyoxylase-like metal-dependent hydrolase (beta-lactamase superfamily II)/rhodanese-related sulfurtransferase
MVIEQIYTDCLSQGSYYIESNGEAAIIDPLREIDSYLEKVKKNNVKIKYIFETHFHADFVSGHLSLSKSIGAPIIFGPNASTSFESIIAKDGEVFNIGSINIKALHTPGHTMESTTYLLRNSEGKDHAIFTGDTLFIGDVGRPDLSQKSSKLKKEDLAGILYESINKKIIPLSDDIIIYPAHGAGSACGKNLSEKTFGTLGEQKKINYALRKNIKKEEFIKEVLEGLDPAPKYFNQNVKLNKEGYQDVNNIIEKVKNELNPSYFETILNEFNALILDVRSKDEFSKAHIPGSIFIGLNGSFAPWVGAILEDIKTPILIISPNGREKETITRLARVGFDNSLGYLKGGINNWISSGRITEKINTISVFDFEKIYKKEELLIYDVRKKDEFYNESLPGSINLSLNDIKTNLNKFSKNNKFYIHCRTGYRSVIASSYLKSKGFKNFVNIESGFEGIKKTKIKVKNLISV